jgi:hypothetical protein
MNVSECRRFGWRKEKQEGEIRVQAIQIAQRKAGVVWWRNQESEVKKQSAESAAEG